MCTLKNKSWFSTPRAAEILALPGCPGITPWTLPWGVFSHKQLPWLYGRELSFPLLIGESTMRSKTETYLLRVGNRRSAFEICLYLSGSQVLESLADWEWVMNHNLGVILGHIHSQGHPHWHLKVIRFCSVHLTIGAVQVGLYIFFSLVVSIFPGGQHYSFYFVVVSLTNLHCFGALGKTWKHMRWVLSDVFRASNQQASVGQYRWWACILWMGSIFL